MKEIIKNLRVVLVLFIIVSLALLAGLFIQEQRSQEELLAVAGENKVALAERYGKFAGRITTKDGFAVAESINGERIYPDKPYSDPYIHLVGDYTHNIANTIESTYESTLMGSDRSIIEQFLLDISGRGIYGSDIQLTLHNGISQVLAEQMRYTGYKGTAVLMNWKTGELLAAVSYPAPSYDSLINYRDFEDSSLYNRILSGSYAPGSTFKMFTSAAWLDSDSFDPNYTVECHGQSLVPNGPGNLNGLSHGIINLNSAFSSSCNVFFGSVGYMMGKDYFLNYLNSLAFSEPIYIDKLSVRRQRADIEVDDAGTIAWFSIGQPIANSVLNITPLTHCMYASAVANDGIRMKAHLVSSVSNPIGRKVKEMSVEADREIFSSETAADLRTLMENAAVYNGLTFGGYTFGLKTGTAEVDGQDGNTSLINTYLYDDNHPYALTMILENSPGSHYLIPFAQNIYREAIYQSP